MAVVEPETAPVSDKPETPTRQADTVAIHTRSLTKQYGDFTAVDSLDLTVNQGEVFGVFARL